VVEVFWGFKVKIQGGKEPGPLPDKVVVSSRIKRERIENKRLFA
jgi:hypothetical protein